MPELDYSRYEQPATKGSTLNTRSLPKVLVPVPPIEQQEELIRVMRRRDEEISGYHRRAATVRADAREFVQAHISRI